MASLVPTRVLGSFLLVTVTSAAPVGGGDLGVLSPVHAPGDFIARLGVGLRRDVVRGGVESEGFRRVGVGIPDASRWDDATLARFQVPDGGRQQDAAPQDAVLGDVGPHEIDAQEVTKEKWTPTGGDQGRIIDVNYAGNYHHAGIPWRNCVSGRDPRCQRPAVRPNLWFLL